MEAGIINYSNIDFRSFRTGDGWISVLSSSGPHLGVQHPVLRLVALNGRDFPGVGPRGGCRGRGSSMRSSRSRSDQLLLRNRQFRRFLERTELSDNENT